MRLLWWGPAPLFTCTLAVGLHPAHTLICSLDHTPSPSGCLHATKPSPLCRFVHWSPNFSIQSLHTQGVGLRLGSTERLVKTIRAGLCPAGCRTLLSPRLPICPYWPLGWWRGSPGWGNLSPSPGPSQRCRACPFVSLLSHMLTCWFFLQLQLCEIFCQCSVHILRIVTHDVFFNVSVGGELHVLLFCHLDLCPQGYFLVSF